MNAHLQQRIEALFHQHERVTLATCGAAGPQISLVTARANGLTLVLFVPHTSDHLFNLEQQPELVLLTPTWKLHGRGVAAPEHPIAPPHAWQTAVRVVPVRLHILNDDSQNSVETLDF
jgi:hypothetical protein